MIRVNKGQFYFEENSPHTLCERHGRDNIKRHIEKKQKEIPARLATRVACLVYGEEPEAAAPEIDRVRTGGLVDYEPQQFDLAYADFAKQMRDLSVSSPSPSPSPPSA